MKLSEQKNETDAISDDWAHFWFGDPLAGRNLALIRLGMALIAFWYFVSHWGDVAFWFSGEGVLASEKLGDFLDDADLADSVQWRLSPLYWVDSPLVLRGYLLLGMAVALLSGWFRQSRALAIAVWLMVVWLANRSLMISGLEELTLAWGLGYLAIGAGGEQPHWSGSLARRLIQVHVTVLILVTGLTMLSSLAWWDGTGVMAVVAPSDTRRIDWTETLKTPWIHEGLTHAIVVGAVLFPVMLWNRRTQSIGLCLTTLWCLGLGLLSSQWMYFASVAVLAQAFLVQNWVDAIFSCTQRRRPSHS
jgi:hypothetical protein